MDFFLGMILPVAFDFAPQNWALCNGQLLAISANSALFSLLGTTYGGNGINNFQLPDLRGRIPLSSGKSSTGRVYSLGEQSGSEAVNLTTTTMPAHNHVFQDCKDTPQSDSPGGLAPASAPDGLQIYISSPPQLAGMVPTTIVGGNQPHENRQPFLGITYVISLVGIYPSRP